MNLSKQQEEIVKTTAKHAVVVAAAASGKTATLVARTKHLLDIGVDPKQIVLITFTNAAAEEISERLDRPLGLFIGTIHSYANYLCLSNGRDTQDIIKEEQFDQLFNKIKQHPEYVKPIDYLLLDEGQDSTEIQFEFMLDILHPKNWMIFADWRQSIYGWAGARPDQILSLTKKDDVTTFSLNENYRNGYNILNFAKNIIQAAGYDYRDDSIPMRDIGGKVAADVEYSPHAIAKTFSQMKDGFGKWFVLMRTNDQIDELAHLFKSYGVPYDTFKRAELDNKELNKKMKENTVKLLTIHTSKGLEADNVIVVGAKFYNLEERCVSYVAATRARNYLVWTRMPNKRRASMMTSNWER